MTSFTSIRVSGGESPSHLFYETGGSEVLLTNDAVQLKERIDDLARRVSYAFPDGEKKNHLFDRLLEVAKSGLQSNFINTSQAIVDLDGVLEEVVSSASIIREGHIKQIWRYACIPVGVGFVLIATWVAFVNFLTVVYDFFSAFSEVDIALIVNGIGSIGFALWGLFVGATLSTYLTNRELSADNFDKIRKYQFSVSEFYRYLYLLTFVFLLLIHFDAITVGLGNILLNSVKEEPIYGLFIGLLCGLSEPAVAGMISGVATPKKLSIRP